MAENLGKFLIGLWCLAFGWGASAAFGDTDWPEPLEVEAQSVGELSATDLGREEQLTAERQRPTFGTPYLPHSNSFRDIESETSTEADAFSALFSIQGIEKFVGATTAPNAPRLQDYFRNDEVRGISLSPDGRKLAIVKRVSSRNFSVFILDLEQDGKVIHAISDPSLLSFGGVSWLNNSRLGVKVLGLAIFGNVLIVYDRTAAIDIDGQNLTPLLTDKRDLPPNLNLSSIAAFLPNDPNHIQMIGFDRTANLYKVNIYNGRGEVVVRGSSNTFAFVVDVNGNPKIRMDLNVRSKLIKVYRYNASRKRWEFFTRISMNDSRDNIERKLAAIRGSDEILMVARKEGDEFTKLHKYSFETNEFEGVVYEHDKYDIQIPISSNWTGELLGVSYIDDRPVHVYFDEDLQNVQTKLEELYPNGTVSIGYVSDDERRYLFFIDEPWRPGSFYIYDAVLNSIRRIVDLNPVLQRASTTAVDMVRYKATDGTEISGYLTFPVGRKNEPLPLIVYPHGGPFFRDWMRFDPIVQYWSTRGYMVFQPNFRGSTGYGRTFEEAGYKEYGGTMVDDVLSGVRALIRSGRVDPQRICSAGISYGGYASLMLPIKSDLFACAVSINGVSDLALQVSWELKATKNREAKKEMTEWFNTRIGDLKKDRDMLNQQSPLVRYREIKVPTLVIAAKDDKTVTVTNSQKLNAVMSEAGMAIEYYEYEKGGHSLARDNALRKMLATTERFFYEHIGHLGAVEIDGISVTGLPSKACCETE